jgi:lipopolysaccharide/colanic/teichoic acid biosynthesis glycosyltransferase
MILAEFLLRRGLSRQWMVLGWILVSGLVIASRFLLGRLLASVRRRGALCTRALVIGADVDGLALARKLGEPGSGVHVAGFLDDFAPPGTVLPNGLTVLGTSAALEQVAARERAQEVIVVPQAVPWETLQHLVAGVVASPTDIRLHLSAGFYDLLTTTVQPCQLNRVPLMTVNRARLRLAEAGVKTALDLALSALLLLVFAPVLLLAALQLTLQGRTLELLPVLGRHGRQFTLLKFPEPAPLDSQFVRKLPGLLNVLRGELSMVGPRPIPAAHAENTVEEAMTLTLKPGLTGPWRQAESAREQAFLDLYYIRSYSLSLDLQVLLVRALAKFRDNSRPNRLLSAVAAEMRLFQLMTRGHR